MPYTCMAPAIWPYTCMPLPPLLAHFFVFGTALFASMTDTANEASTASASQPSAISEEEVNEGAVLMTFSNVEAAAHKKLIKRERGEDSPGKLTFDAQKRYSDQVHLLVHRRQEQHHRPSDKKVA